MLEEGVLPPLAFRGRWRRYQELALQAFERDRRAGRRSTHLVAPPGSGKTVLGMEIVRRLGARSLVLCPSSAVQAQWLRTAELFGARDGVAAPDPNAPIACLTYQSLCQIQDPGVALGNAAERRWAVDRARALGVPVAEVERDVATWRDAAARRRTGELARIKAALKREIARGEHDSVDLADLLEPAARRRVETLRRLGVATLVLDECHHLASLWGYVVRAAASLLGDVHLVGLTATPPDELTEEEAELYHSLLGPVDFTVPTPAVVRDRCLAPYQELAWLTEPLESEVAWLREHDLRFRQLLTDLHRDDDGSLSFPEWVITRLRVRGTGQGEPEVPWASFQRRHPALARAGVRFLASAELVLPEGAPRGEGYREPPMLDDWLVLLEDYALRCLVPDSSQAAAERYQAIAAALRDLGYRLTRQGIRRAASDADLLLANSTAKTLALTELLVSELDARGERLRALVLCDAELVRKPSTALVGVLRPEAGTAPVVVRALAADDRTAVVRPLLVSGRGLRCAPHDADHLLGALAAAASEAGEPVTGLRVEPAGEGLVRLVADGPEWQPRQWVPLATRILTRGATWAVVGTRALLGEGWDAPCVNCLVDLTMATTGVSVRQMRGRSLRLDPTDPQKLASNWDVVCVAPDLPNGLADYDRFVRKHLKLYAPSEDGLIEAGPTHVHPALGPFAPPPTGQFATINRAAAARAREWELARARWRIGAPYHGEDHDTLVVRHGRNRPTVTPASPPERPPRYPYDQQVPLTLGIAGAAGGAILAILSGEPAALAAAAALPAGLAWAGARLGRVKAELADALPLDRAARAILDAYQELGELSAEAAASLAIEPRASGYLRCLLRDATEAESARFTHALDELLSPPDAPRYLLSRLVPGRAGRGRPLLRLLAGRTVFPARWEAVPRDLGRRKDRAETFARAWRRWIGPGELLFTHRTEAGRAALAQAGAQSIDYETSARKIWV